MFNKVVIRITIKKEDSFKCLVLLKQLELEKF